MNARNSFQTIFSELKQIMLDLYSSRRQNDKYYLLSITKYMKLRFLPFRRHPFQNGEIRNLRQVSWEFYLAKGIFMILILEESVWRANLQKNFVSFNFELHATLNQGLSCMCNLWKLLERFFFISGIP